MRVRAQVYVRAGACESTQARSPKWNSMTELEREKGNSCGKGEGGERDGGAEVVEEGRRRKRERGWSERRMRRRERA